jgi:hypothetical protein
MKHHQRHPHPHKPRADLSHFYVILVISNPVRYSRRYELYWKTYEMCLDAGVNVITVEAQLGCRPFMVTENGNPNHVQIRTIEELWHKENMINLGVDRALHIDPQAREVMWNDADCFPMAPAIDWFEETWHALQHYEFVQCWEYLINFGPQNQPCSSPQMSFMKTYIEAGCEVPKAKAGVKHTLAGHSGLVTLGRPGLAWAANVSAFMSVGGLIDGCILGSGDWHMAHGLVGAMDQGTWEFKLSRYSEYLLEWQVKAERWIKRDVGYVPMTVGHWFHGNKADRGYGSRGGILVDNAYNPYTDIKYDGQGLLQLETYEPRQIKMRDQIRRYFRSRNEDSVDLRS